MASVRKVQSLADYKVATNCGTLRVVKSKSGNIYAINAADDLVAWCSEDINLAEPMVVFSMVEGDDSWDFIANGVPKERDIMGEI